MLIHVIIMQLYFVVVLLLAIGALSSVNHIGSNEELWQWLCSNGSNSSLLQDGTTLLLTETRYELRNDSFCIVRGIKDLIINSSTAGHSSNITCLSSTSDISTVGFGFINITGMTIHNINFHGCGATLTQQVVGQMNETHPHFFYQQKAALAFNHCRNIQLRNVNILYYNGYAVLLMNPLGESTLKGMTIMYGIFAYHRSCLAGSNICAGSGLMCVFKDTNTTLGLTAASSTVNFTNTNFRMNYNFIQNIPALSLMKREELCTLPLVSAAGVTIIFNQTFEASFTCNSIIWDMYEGTVAGASLVLYYNGMFNSRATFSHVCTKNALQMSSAHQRGGGGITVFSVLCGRYRIHNISSYKIPLKIMHSYLRGNAPNYNMRTKLFIKYGSGLFLNILDACSPQQLTIVLERIKYRWNYAYVSGSAVYAYKSLKTTNVSLVLSNNLAEECIIGHHKYSDVPCLTFINWKNVTIIGGSFWDNNAPVFGAYNSEVYVTGVISFTTNQGVNGPAFYFHSSYLILQEPLNAHFANNNALLFGGAVYADNTLIPASQRCALQIKTVHKYDSNKILNIRLRFKDNEAGLVGSSMYINPLYNCSPIYPSIMESSFNWSKITKVYETTSSHNLNQVSSVPFKICFCSYSHDFSLRILCSFTGIASHIIHTFPGMTIIVPLCAVDASGSIVYSAAIASIGSNRLTKNDLSQYYLYLLHKQTLSPLSGRNCTYVSYNVYSKTNTLRHAIFSVAVQSSSPSWSAHMYVHPCPLGFVLSNDECVCDSLLIHLVPGVQCNITNTSISISSGQWLGNVSNSLVSSFLCPPSNCRSDVHYLNVTDPLSLCTDTKEGVLCGQCRAGLSVVFGTSQCIKCSDIWMFSLIGYVVSGLVLVAIMLYLPLTISEGPLAGIIIAMNLIAGSTIDLLEGTGEWFLYVTRVCASIVNLSLGFPLCLYNGMTPLIKTGLLFVYPVYLWVLIILFIIFSHYSTHVSNRTAMHSVQVLATLMYLSFSKILMTVIDIIAFIPVHTSRNGTMTVWYGDGSVSYLSDSGHLILFALAVVSLLLYILPFILFVLLGQWLLRLRCVSMYMRQFLEAFQGPYNQGKGYWFGIRVLIVTLVYLFWSVLRGYNITLMLFLQFLPVIALCCFQLHFRPFRNQRLNKIDTICLLMPSLQMLIAIAFNEGTVARLYIIGSINMILFIGLFVVAVLQCIKKVSKRFYTTKRSVRICQELEESEVDESRKYLAALLHD